MDATSVQAWSTVVLVVITAFYAWRTHTMARGTEALARDTKRLAEAAECQRRDAEEAEKRVLMALAADVRRVKELTAHNARAAKQGMQLQPGILIRYPTQVYELVLFSGQSVALVSLPALTALMGYLQQAHHVNAMMSRVELHYTAGPQGRLPTSERDIVLSEIARYSEGEVRSALEQLEHEVAAA